LTLAAERYEKVVRRASLAGANLQSINQKLIQMERALTSPDGLPNRSWFKHQIYAPGLYTGYGVKTIPAVREAIEQKQWKEADAQIAKVGKVLEREAAEIDAAAAELEKQAK
jgi:N-acetylated-alpha-linked acidic dipeptidase